jgi:sulfatase modifying factor 1
LIEFKSIFLGPIFVKLLVKEMRKYIFLGLLFFVFGCSKNDRGELVGVKAGKFFSNAPQGMVLIPSGSFTMGPSTPNKALDLNPTLKTVSLKAFYMDETEITNSEYRQFVNWVRDSVVRDELARAAFEKLDYDPDTEDPMFEYYPIPQYETDDEDNTCSSNLDRWNVES